MATFEWWDGPLEERWGAEERLCGIKVFHDFPWLDVFPDERTQFIGGRQLASTVIEQCSEGLTPGLVLTQNESVDQGFLKTGAYSLFVVNIDEWLRTPGNVALSYLAKHLAVEPSALGSFAQLIDIGDAHEVRAFIERELDVDHVADWLGRDSIRLQRLAELVELRSQHPATVEHALDAIGALGQLDAGQVQTLVAFVVQATDDDQLHDLLRGATNRKPGRDAAREVLGERVWDRVADAREDLAAYSALYKDPDTSETDMQRFLEKHPLVFGLEYVSVSSGKAGPSGSMDFVLERIDGYSDVVELKGPNEPIIASTKATSRPGSPSPHTYRLSPALAQAIAQAMAYRDRLTRFSKGAKELYGVSKPREPRLIIVLGRMSDLEKHQRRVLKELNRSLHRAEVVPYDLIGRRAKQSLDNIETYLGRG